MVDPKHVLRVAFDIGGVLSKYPDELRRMANCLNAGGAEVFVLTDMLNREHVLNILSANGFAFIRPDRVHLAQYDQHGEGCKAELLRDLSIDVFLDDCIGYVTPGGAPVRCLVMPDATRPYYHETWKSLGEDSFGRATYKEPMK